MARGQETSARVPDALVSVTVTGMKRGLWQCPTSVGLLPHCFIG